MMSSVRDLFLNDISENSESSDNNLNNSNNNNNDNVKPNTCVVQLVFASEAPLGMAIFHPPTIPTGYLNDNNNNSHNSYNSYNEQVLRVWDVIEGGQGERLAIGAMLEPQIFAGATILAVNGVQWNSHKLSDNDSRGSSINNASEALWNELKSEKRPKSIVFWLHPQEGDPAGGPDIFHSVGVNKIYGDYVELVFHADTKVMGILPAPPTPLQLQSTTTTTGTGGEPPDRNNCLRLKGLVPDGAAAMLAQEICLDPADFCGASIVAINGKFYHDRNKTIRALQTSIRPTSVLFALAKIAIRNGQETTPIPRVIEEMEAAEAAALAAAPTIPTASAAGFSPRSSQKSATSTASSGHHRRRSSKTLKRSMRTVSSQKLENAKFASISMRALLVEQEDQAANDHHGSHPLLMEPPPHLHKQPSVIKEDPTMSSMASIPSPRSAQEKEQQTNGASPKTATTTIQETIVDDPVTIERRLSESAQMAEKLNAENEKSTLEKKLSESAQLAAQLNAENERMWGGTNHSDSGSSFNNDNNNNNNVVVQEESALAFRARAIVHRFRNLDLGDTINSGFSTGTGLLRKKLSKKTSSDSSEVDELSFGEDPEALRKEAYEACLKFVRDHLEAFIEETPNVTYEEWIEEIHPENARLRQSANNTLTVDHRFYVEGSDHRRLWNENLGGVRKFVPVRHYDSQKYMQQAQHARRISWAQGSFFRRSSVSVEFVENLEDMMPEDL